MESRRKRNYIHGYPVPRQLIDAERDNRDTRQTFILIIIDLSSFLLRFPLPLRVASLGRTILESYALCPEGLPSR
jgi:hypothetical protein